MYASSVVTIPVISPKEESPKKKGKTSNRKSSKIDVGEKKKKVQSKKDGKPLKKEGKPSKKKPSKVDVGAKKRPTVKKPSVNRRSMLKGSSDKIGNVSDPSTTLDSSDVIIGKTIRVRKTATTKNVDVNPTNPVPFSGQICSESPIPIFESTGFEFDDVSDEGESGLLCSDGPLMRNRSNLTTEGPAVREVGESDATDNVEMKIFSTTKHVRFFLKPGGERKRKNTPSFQLR